MNRQRNPLTCLFDAFSALFLPAHLFALTKPNILLHGQTGPIDGVTYGEVLMLPLAQDYNDEQIASVLNYFGERWHRWNKPVPAKAIETVRKTLGWSVEPPLSPAFRWGGEEGLKKQIPISKMSEVDAMAAQNKK